MFRNSGLTVVLALAITAAAWSQTITSVSPAAASPGDIITVRGSFPNPITHIRFTANVGGFLGVDTRFGFILSATSTEVKVVVPTMAGFAPPAAAPPGDPNGTVEARDVGGSISPPANFFFNQGSALDPFGSTNMLQSHGLGDTNSGGCRAAASFDITNGPPNSIIGNPNFTLTLENATAFAPCVLVGGVAAIPPTVALNDGLVAIDITQPVLIFPAAGSYFTDANGRFALLAPIPGGAQLFITFTVMWVYIDGPGFVPRISNGLIVNI